MKFAKPLLLGFFIIAVYGPQPGDNEARITRVDQQKQVVEATAQFLKELRQ